MAHNLKNHDKQQGRRQAWHGLTEIKEDLTLDNCWLSTWDILPRSLSFSDDGTPSGDTRLTCTDAREVRLGNAYNPLTFFPISNKDFIQLVKNSIGGTDHTLESVGSVRNRGRVFASFELKGKEKFQAAGREFAAFLNYGNGHDKSSVLWGNTSNTCTVCDNTFSRNLFQVEQADLSATATDENQLNFRQRHTKNARMKFPDFALLVDRAVGVQAEFAKAMDELAMLPVNEPHALFAGFLGRDIKDPSKGFSTRRENTSLTLLKLFKSGAGNEGRNLADAFSAVTDFYTHSSSGGENRNRQILSSEYGAGQVAKESFWGIVNNPEQVNRLTMHGLALLSAPKDEVSAN